MSAKILLPDVEEVVAPESSHISHAEDPETASVLPAAPIRTLGKWRARIIVITRPISRLHQRTPYLNRLPGFVLFPISIVAIINCAVWAIVGIVLRFHPYPQLFNPFDYRTLVAPVALSYTFGLRHALDADHIAAIDNVRDR